jgi:hypothetical protein
MRQPLRIDGTTLMPDAEIIREHQRPAILIEQNQEMTPGYGRVKNWLHRRGQHLTPGKSPIQGK